MLQWFRKGLILILLPFALILGCGSLLIASPLLENAQFWIDKVQNPGLPLLSPAEIRIMNEENLKKQDYTAKSISRKINSIKSFFRFSKTKQLVESNPAANITHPKYEVKPPRVLSKMEYRALRDACRTDRRISAIVELLLQTGIRIGELANLKIDDLNFDANNIRIRPYESHEERTIPLTKAAKQSLDEYLKERPKSREKTLFLTKTGRPFLVRNIRAAIDRYFKIAGIENAKVNDLRHTFITQQLIAGTPLVYISKLAGHKRLSTTEKYLKIINEKLDKEDVKLEEL